MLGSFTRLTTLAIPIPRSLSPCFAHRSRNQNRKTGHIERRKSHLASALRNEPNYSPRANESKKGGKILSLPFHLCSSITTECLYHTFFPETREINTIIFTRRKKKNVQIVVLSIIPFIVPRKERNPNVMFENEDGNGAQSVCPIRSVGYRRGGNGSITDRQRKRGCLGGARGTAQTLARTLEVS